MIMTLVVTPIVSVAGIVRAAMPLVATMVLATVPVARYVFIVVPVVSHKVDRTTAGIVLRAVLAPVLLVARGHVQVNRRG